MKKSNSLLTIPIVLTFYLFCCQCSIAQIPGYVPSDGLVGWWPLDGNANDLSMNQLNGSIYNSSVATNRFGELNKAYSFNGSNGYIEVPHNYQLNSLPITISIWFLPNQVNGGGPLVSKYMNASWNGWNVGITGPTDSTETMSGHYILQSPYVWGSNPCNCGCRGVIEGYGDCGSGITYRGELYDQQWHLSTFVVDSVGGRFYLDGQPVSSQVWAGLPQQVSNWYGMLIGAYRTSGQWSFYKGKLDDLGIWNRALSDQEISSLYVTSDCQPSAHVYNDYGQTCTNTNLGVGGVLMQIQPGNYVVQSDLAGDFYLCDLNLEDGSYTASINPAEFGWESNCPLVQEFQVSNGTLDTQPTFLVFSDDACPSPEVSILCPTMRRCSEHTWPIFVQACNDNLATGVLENAYVQVELDQNIIVDPANTPPYTIVNGLYQFELGDIVPGECIDLVINANFSCDLELGETLCMEAALYPVPDCLQDTVPVPGPCELPWDRSSLSVNGVCDEANGLIVFTVTNGGEDMDCQSQVRVYIDGVLDTTFYIQLGAGETYTYSVPATGQTYILQADQHPLHPGNSHPNDHVEACGGDSDWTPGLVDDLPSGDESPFVDDFCGEVVGSFDPNDKQGFPDGVGESHDVLPNGQIQYLVRFQNTGTAPAYTVVVRDTLDADLDIFSVTPGVSSHEYSFTMYGERILQWTFNNIMLPDSFSNEEQSHGFLTYTVNQMPDLANGVEINNSAAIYFDSNEPVITNTTLHTINNCLFRETYATLDITSVGAYVGPDGQSYDAAGSYTIVLQNAAGCDSIITLNLSIEPSFSCDILVNQASQGVICSGSEIELQAQTDGITATDNGGYFFSDFESCNLNQFTYSGGSIGITNSAYEGSCAVGMSHYAGQQPNNFYPTGQNFLYGTYKVRAIATGFISDNNMYLFQGDELGGGLSVSSLPNNTDNPGLYINGLGISYSTPTINVTQGEWYELKVEVFPGLLNVYINGSLRYTNTEFTAPTAGRYKLGVAFTGNYDNMEFIPYSSAQYLWSNGETTASITVSPSETTTYSVTVTQGDQTCTSEVTISVSQPSSSTIEATITEGESYDFNGQSLTTAGTYEAVLVNAAGCDSIIVLNLVVESIAIDCSIASSNTQTCAGDEVQLSVDQLAPCNGTGQPQWQLLISDSAFDGSQVNFDQAGFDAASGKLYSVLRGSGINRVEVFDLNAGTVNSLTNTGGPGELYEFALDISNSRIVANRVGRDAVFALPINGGSWQAIGGGSFDAESYGCASFWNPVSNRFGYFGGYGYYATKNWVWESGTNWINTYINNNGCMPPKRVSTQLARNAGGNKLFLFSGQGSCDGNQFASSCALGSPWATDVGVYCWLRDIWELDLATYQFTNVMPVNSQSITKEGAFAYDFEEDDFYVLGGFTPSPVYGANTSASNTMDVRRYRRGTDTGFEPLVVGGEIPPTPNDNTGIGMSVYDEANNRIIYARRDGIWALSLSSCNNQITWSNGATTPSITISPSETTTYSVTVTQGDQTCTSEVTIEVLPNETYYADADGDGFGNYEMPLVTCDGMPEGYVMDNTDCDDSDDAVYISAACDDNDPCTTGDIILTDCSCAGTFADADNDGTCDANDNCAGPEAGTACDDNDPCTVGDAILADCSCAGTFADADNDGTCDANDNCAGPEAGAACDDSNPCTVNDIILADCSCAGTFADADNDGTCDANDNCAGPEAGAACDDNNACTVNDIITEDCVCLGTPVAIGTSTTNITACDSFVWNGASYATSGSFEYATTNAYGCDSIATLVLTIQQSSIAPTGAIASVSSAVAGSSVTLSVIGGSLGTGALWKWYSASCGGTLVGTGTSVSVTVNATTTFFVRAEGTCNNTSCASVTVTVQPACGPTNVSASASSICAGNPITLSVSGSTGSGGTWKWYRNSCGSGFCVGSGATLTVSPNITTNYFVRSEGGSCGTSSCLSITVTVNPLPARPTTISGTTYGVCGLQNVIYNVSTSSGATTYQWTLPAGATIVSGQGTASITVNFSNTIGNNNTCGNTSICVRAGNSCGWSSYRCVALQLAPNAPTTISGADEPCSGQVTTYSIASVAGATSYVWSVPSGFTLLSGQGTTEVAVLPGSIEGSVSVKAVNACGSSKARSKFIEPESCGADDDDDEEGDDDDDDDDIRSKASIVFGIWPNPASERVYFACGKNKPELLEIYDITGRSMYNSNWIPEYDVSGLAGGIYFVRATYGGESVVKRMEVVR